MQVSHYVLGIECGNTTELCDAIDADVSYASSLAKKYPSNVFLLRYEDLVITPYATLDILLNFLELPPEPCMDAYLENHVGKKRQEHIHNMTFLPWLNFRNNCLTYQYRHIF